MSELERRTVRDVAHRGMEGMTKKRMEAKVQVLFMLLFSDRQTNKKQNKTKTAVYVHVCTYLSSRFPYFSSRFFPNTLTRSRVLR